MIIFNCSLNQAGKEGAIMKSDSFLAAEDKENLKWHDFLFLWVKFLPPMITPNLITVFRIIIAGYLIILLKAEKHNTALFLYLVTAYLDAADGSLARIKNKATKLGAFLDPTSDKILNFTVYICLLNNSWSDHYLSLIAPIIIIDSLLFLISVFKFSLSYTRLGLYIKLKQEGANIYGKIKMNLQISTLVILLLQPQILSQTGTTANLLLDLLLLTCTAFGTASLIQHLEAIRIK